MRKDIHTVSWIFVLMVCVALLLPTAHASNQRGAKRGGGDGSPTKTVDLRSDLVALVIGASEYRRGWDPLPGVKRDVAAVENRLRLSGFTDIVVVSDPDRADIEKAFDRIAGKFRSKDAPGRLLVYYAGHGENLDGEGYLVPVDAPHSMIDRAGFRAKAIELRWVRQQMSMLPARQVLLLLDNCFAGSVFSTMRGTPLHPPAIGYMVASRSRAIVAAGTENQVVPDESIFRRYFIAALAGAGDLDKDGYITGTEISLFLRSGVANESGGKQTPLFAKLMEEDFYKGDFVLLSPLHAAASPLITEDLDEPQSSVTSRTRDGLLRDCERGFCPRMVIIPGGNFVFGAPAAESGRSPDDLSPAPRSVASFAISQHEITFDAWDACFQDGGCTKWPDDGGMGRGGKPVINVTWNDALQFTAWLSMKTGLHYRLPTEIEWEYAARGGMSTARHWGEELSTGLANCADCGTSWSARSSAPVGSFPANRFHLHDMLGNVWEWTSDCWGVGQTGVCASYAIRGGSWSTAARGVRSAARSAYPAGSGAKSVGFRVVRDST